MSKTERYQLILGEINYATLVLQRRMLNLVNVARIWMIYLKKWNTDASIPNIHSFSGSLGAVTLQKTEIFQNAHFEYDIFKIQRNELQILSNTEKDVEWEPVISTVGVTKRVRWANPKNPRLRLRSGWDG